MSTPFRTPIQARAVTTERTFTHRSYNEREVVVDVDEVLESEYFSESNTPLLTTVDSMNQIGFPEVLGNEGNLELLEPEVLEGPQISLETITSTLESDTSSDAPITAELLAEAVINDDKSEVRALCALSSDAEVEEESGHYIASSFAEVEGDGDAEEEAAEYKSSSVAAEEVGDAEDKYKEVQHTLPLSAAAEEEGQKEGVEDEIEHTVSSSSAAEEEGFAERNVEGELEEECKGMQLTVSPSSAAAVDAGTETAQCVASSYAQKDADGGADGEGEPEEDISSSSATTAAATDLECYTVPVAEAEVEVQVAQCLALSAAEVEEHAEGEGEGMNERENERAQHAVPSAASGVGDAPLIVPDMSIVADTALPANQTVTTPAQVEIMPISLYVINDVVDVESRVWPGMNKPGGRARITKVYTVYPSGGKRTSQL